MASSSARPLSLPVRVLFFASIPSALMAIGTVGYRLTERWSWFNSLYVAVITLTSIGYGDKQPVSQAGRVVTMALAVGGVSTIAIAATELLRTIITGDLRDFAGRRRMEKRIDALAQHVILCGYGSVGQYVCAELLGGGVPVVVVDRKPGPLAAARRAGAHPVLGDATAEPTLKRAGIERARALIAVAGTDADNVLITMTARPLAPRLTILSRAEEEATVPKLLRAGASSTARPHAIAGGRMAQAVLRPATLDAELELSEQLVMPGSALDGTTVGRSGLRARRGVMLVAIRRRDGQVTFNPGDDAPVAAGDTLITVGSRERPDASDAHPLS